MNFKYRIQPTLDNTIWYFGCSFTWGTDVDIEQTAPFQLSKLINQPVDNLGIQGASPDLIYFQIRKLIKQHTPKLIIIQWPSDTRTFKIINDEIINLGIWVLRKNALLKNNHPDIVEGYQKSVFDGAVQKHNNFCKENLSRLVSCPIVPVTYDKFIDIASDDRHPGPLTHSSIAKTVAQSVIKLNTSCSKN